MLATRRDLPLAGSVHRRYPFQPSIQRWKRSTDHNRFRLRQTRRVGNASFDKGVTGTPLAPLRFSISATETGDAPDDLSYGDPGAPCSPPAPALAVEAPAPKPPATTIPEKIAPGAEPSGPAQNLSEKLNQSGGVIQPKEVDPDMHKEPPATGDPNIVRPPGTGSGDAKPRPAGRNSGAQ